MKKIEKFEIFKLKKNNLNLNFSKLFKINIEHLFSTRKKLL